VLKLVPQEGFLMRMKQKLMLLVNLGTLMK